MIVALLLRPAWSFSKKFLFRDRCVRIGQVILGRRACRGL